MSLTLSITWLMTFLARSGEVFTDTRMYGTPFVDISLAVRDVDRRDDLSRKQFLADIEKLRKMLTTFERCMRRFAAPQMANISALGGHHGYRRRYRNI